MNQIKRLVAIAIVALGAFGAYRVYDHYRIKVGHTILMGPSQAPFGPDATVTVQISNYGRYEAEHVSIEARWPGSTMQIMGGDGVSLAQSQASFHPLSDGGFGCSKASLKPGEVMTVMFSVRRDPAASDFDPQPGNLDVRVHGHLFSSERFLRLPLAGIDD